ncbi:hypothetical protein EV121DRAFT_271469 [Schizophyllum commune]
MEDQTVEEQRIEDPWFDDGDIKIAVGDQVLHWLKAMLLPGYFERYPQRIHKDKLLAVLCLSHKYLVDTLRQRCLLHLGGKFGTSLRTQQRWPWYFDDYEREMTIITDGMFDRDFLCALIPIAREIGALWILPALFYDLHFVSSTEKEWLDSPSVPLAQEDVAHLRRIEVICDAHFSIYNLGVAMDDNPCPRFPSCCVKQAGKLGGGSSGATCASRWSPGPSAS